ncbi:MAG: hypothetical protein ACRYG5_15885 [Janthinobacterium lividum]
MQREPRRLSLQQIYDRISHHLLAQGSVSEDEAGSCRLRGLHGRRCSTGSLVDDAHYSTELEQIGIGYYALGGDGALPRALQASGIDMREPAIRALLVDCQDMHDGETPANWPERLIDIARRHSLPAWCALPA